MATAAATVPAAKKKSTSHTVRPFANIHLSSALGLVAEATREAAIKSNPELAARLAAKKAAAASSQNQKDDDAVVDNDDDDDILAAVQLDPRNVTSAVRNTMVRALVLTPSVVSAKPKPASGSKGKPFPGFCKFTVMVLGPPGASGNKVGLKTPGNSLAAHGRLAYLAAQTLEKVGFDEETQKNKFKQQSTDEKAVLAEGTLIEITASGQVARPTHTKDGSPVDTKQLAMQPEIKCDDVISVTLDDIVLRDGGIQAKARAIRPLGTATENFANLVLHSLAEAGQRSFTPLVVREDFDWASVKVERKDDPEANGGGAGGAADAQQQQGDNMDTDDGATGNGNRPTNAKVQKAGSACMTPESARALWTKHVVGTFGTPRDTNVWREAANQELLANGSPVFDPTDTQQWVKKQKEGEAAPKPGEPVQVQIRYALPTRQVHWLSSVHCAVTSVMLNQTVPQQLLYRFGISDPDYQPFVRAMICNGVFAMMAAPMTQGWFTRYFEGEEFSQSFYPSMTYVGERGNKKADVKSAAFYVDHACTLLNSAVPVTREFIVVLMLLMRQLVNSKRFHFDMTAVKKADRKDSLGRPIEDNFLETRVDASGAQAVVNVFECQFNMTKELVGHAFYALVENVPKTADVMQRVFAEHGEHAPAYFSAMLLQAFVTRYALLNPTAAPVDIFKPIEATNQVLKRFADELAEQAASGMDGAAGVPADFVRPAGAPSLKMLLSKTVEAARREEGTSVVLENPQYIGDNALQLDEEELKAFRVLPWAISHCHLEQRGLPALYAGVASHYEYVYPQVAAAFDQDEGLMPLDKYVDMRKVELAPLMEEMRKRQEAALSAELSPEEEAALQEVEKASAAAAATANPPAMPTPAKAKKSAAAAAASGTKPTSALTAKLTKKPTTTTTTATKRVVNDDDNGDNDSEHSRRQRRKLPDSFLNPPSVEGEDDYVEDDNDAGEEEDDDPVDVDATQPADNGVLGGVLTLAPEDGYDE